MNFLSLFVLIPVLMMVGLFLSKNLTQIRAVAVTGASLLLALAVGLVFAANAPPATPPRCSSRQTTSGTPP